MDGAHNILAVYFQFRSYALSGVKIDGIDPSTQGKSLTATIDRVVVPRPCIPPLFCSSVEHAVLCR